MPNVPITDYRRAIFNFLEGEVTVSFPEKLSVDSIATLEDYLLTLIEQLKREAHKNQSTID